MKDKIMRSALNVIASVMCSKCGAVHNADGETYVTIFGDITLGAKSPVLPTNFDEKGKLVGSTIRCRKNECVPELLEMFIEKPTTKAKNK